MIETDTVAGGGHLVGGKWGDGRRMNDLLVQLKQDQAELNRRWERFKTGEIDSVKVEELERIIGWVKKEIVELEKLRDEGIEGVLWAEIKDIEKDVGEKERILRVIIFDIHNRVGVTNHENERAW